MSVVTVDPRPLMVADVVRAGDSFLEVGGVERPHREMVTVAHAWGATSLTMLDRRPASDPLWQECRRRWAGLSVECLAGVDLLSPQNRVWDVVYCGSVLHHVADPKAAVVALRRLTGRSCVLTALVTDRRAHLVTQVGWAGVQMWKSELTGEQLLALCAAAGFAVRESVAHWHGHLVTLTLEPA